MGRIDAATPRPGLPRTRLSLAVACASALLAAAPASPVQPGMTQAPMPPAIAVFADPATRALAEAAASGDTAAVARLAKPDLVNQPGLRGVTPLMWAWNSGSVAGLRALLEAGADPNLQTQAGCVMSWAAHAADPAVLGLLLDHGGNPNLVNSDGLPLVQQAALDGSKAHVMLLLNHGADINARAPDGDTLVQIYANLNQFDTVEELIARGADYRSKTSSGGSVERRVRSREIDPGPARDAQMRLRARLDAESRAKTEQVH